MTTERLTHAWLKPVAAAMRLRLRTDKEVDDELRSDNRPDIFENAHPIQSDPLLYGMVISHWTVGPVCRIRTKDGGAVRFKRGHVCVSKCGVVSQFQTSALYDGATKHCAACRNGGSRARPTVPAHRVADESRLAEIQLLWEQAIVSVTSNVKVDMEVRSNLKIAGNGKDRNPAVDAWHQAGLPLLRDFVSRTKHGPHFGWKVFVQHVKTTPAEKVRESFVYVQAESDSTKRLTLALHAAGTNHTFIVDLACGRSDVPWKDVKAELYKQIDGLNGKNPAPPEFAQNPQPTVEPVAAAATEPTEAPVTQAIDIGKLTHLRNNLDKLLSVGKDVNEIAQLKAAATVKLDQARQQAERSQKERQRADEEVQVCTDLRAAQLRRVEAYERQLKNARVDWEALAERVEKALAVQRSVNDDAAPVLADLAKAEAEVRDLEKMEAEQTKVLGDATGIAALLKALAAMG